MEKTDLEKFTELYKSIGLTFGILDNPEGTTIKIENENEDEKIGGLYGLYTYIEFDKKGKFIRQSFYC